MSDTGTKVAATVSLIAIGALLFGTLIVGMELALNSSIVGRATTGNCPATCEVTGGTCKVSPAIAGRAGEDCRGRLFTERRIENCSCLPH
ncbi:hypothetical protein HY490_05915 [Candidatus Woesearchaeota archaeon]|nr:hypothetical protein [Candidatus Woesearchaeota archaeon]